MLGDFQEPLEPGASFLGKSYTNGLSAQQETEKRDEEQEIKFVGHVSNCYVASSSKFSSYNNQFINPPTSAVNTEGLTESVNNSFWSQTAISAIDSQKKLPETLLQRSQSNGSNKLVETGNQSCSYQENLETSSFSDALRAMSICKTSSPSHDSLINSSPSMPKPVKSSPQQFSPPSPYYNSPSAKFQPSVSPSSQKSQLDSPESCEAKFPASSTETSDFFCQNQSSSSPLGHRVLIVGAGCSGLAAIKSCLDEGLQPVCLERSSDLGGLWNYQDNDITGNAGIYRSLVINTSKEMMMFSNFPPPESFPPFLTHEKVLEYFRLYADHFGLLRYIRFGAEVKRVSRADDYHETGKWKVEYVWRTKTRARSRGISTDEAYNSSDTESDSTQATDPPVQEVFDGVMVCAGHHSVPYVPHISGLEDFQGQVLHSRFYKQPAPFVGKRVVILGMGNSAVDIACDLSKTAKQVFLCSRRGCWVVPRTSFWGLPADMLANSRVVFTLPYRLLDWIVQVQANCRVDHDGYGLRPQHGVLNCHPTINDELPIHLVSGRVQTKPTLTHVRSRGVTVEGGEFIPCDVIVLATGYDYRVDFVDSDVFKVENNQSRLYKFMVPPHLPHPTLTVIGLIQAIGAAMPISEIQTRWAAKLITGEVKLPSHSEMLEDYDKRKSTMGKLYVQSRRHSMQTFWIDYMDQIASKIGAKPNLWKVLLSDPWLALKCYLGPCLPAQYRLVGDHTWPGARDFILRVFTRAFRSRNKPLPKSQSLHNDKSNVATLKTGPDAETSMSDSETNDEAVGGLWSVLNDGSAETSSNRNTSEKTERGYFRVSPSVFASHDSQEIRKREQSVEVVSSKTQHINQTSTRDYAFCIKSVITEDAHTHNIPQTDVVGVTEVGIRRSWTRPPTSEMTFTFYLWAIVICCIAWGVSHVFGQLVEFLIG